MWCLFHCLHAHHTAIGVYMFFAARPEKPPPTPLYLGEDWRQYRRALEAHTQWLETYHQTGNRRHLRTAQICMASARQLFRAIQERFRRHQEDDEDAAN